MSGGKKEIYRDDPEELDSGTTKPIKGSIFEGNVSKKISVLFVLGGIGLVVLNRMRVDKSNHILKSNLSQLKYMKQKK